MSYLKLRLQCSNQQGRVESEAGLEIPLNRWVGDGGAKSFQVISRSRCNLAADTILFAKLVRLHKARNDRMAAHLY